jgi:hypothetical protein
VLFPGATANLMRPMESLTGTFATYEARFHLYSLAHRPTFLLATRRTILSLRSVLTTGDV